MAVDYSLVNPMEGWNQSVKSLAGVAALQEEKRRNDLLEKRQAAKDAMELEDWQFKKSERERKLADEEERRKVYTEALTGTRKETQNYTEANPAFNEYQQGLSAYTTANYPPAPEPQTQADRDIAGLQTAVNGNLGLAQLNGSNKRLGQMIAERQTEKEMQSSLGASQPTPEAIAQDYMGAAPAETLSGTREIVRPHSATEQADMMANVHLKQGDIKTAMETFKGRLDITTLVPKHKLQMAQTLLAAAQPYLALGEDPEAVKAKITAEYQGKVDPEDLQGFQAMKLQKGGVATTSLPNGETVVAALQADGTMKLSIEKPVAKTGSTKIMSDPVTITDTVLGKTVQLTGSYQFHDTTKATAEQAFALYDKLVKKDGVDPQEAAKQVNTLTNGGVDGSQFKSKDTDKPANVSLTMGIPRESVQGVVTSGKYAGQVVYKNSKGGPPFVYQTDANGKTVEIPVPGVPFDARTNAAAYITPQTAPNAQTPVAAPGELTPSEKKANVKSQSDPVAMRVVKRIDGVIPVLKQMKTQFAELPNETGVVPLNKFLRGANVMLGNVKIDSYDTFVKEATREVQSAVSGNQSSQKMVMQQIDVLKNSKTNSQRAAAMDSIITVLEERKKSELSVPFRAKTETRTYKGKTYTLTPGADRTKQESWVAQ